MAGSRRNDAPGNIRSGVFVLGNRGNILSDESAEYVAPPESVCILVISPSGKILSVSRGKNIYDLNLPGGGIKPGEDPEDAARRELQEETGIIAGKMIEIHRGSSTTKMCVTYKVLDYSGKLKSSPEGLAKWSEPEELLDGTFGRYFQNLSLKLGIL